MTTEICGAARTLRPGGLVVVCERRPTEHAALDHHDPRHGISWPVCESYCAAAGHICGRYRGGHQEQR